MPRLLIGLLPLGVLGAGCGENESSLAPSSTTPAAAPAAAAVEAPASTAVEIQGFTYSPARVTVRRGGEVTWTDKDAANHTVTFAEDGVEDVENIREGRSATVTFEKRGSYAYICEFHPGMAGTVEVV